MPLARSLCHAMQRPLLENPAAAVAAAASNAHALCCCCQATEHPAVAAAAAASPCRYALTGKEVKMILMQRLVKVDGKARTDTTYPAGFMDVITLDKTDDHFRCGVLQHYLYFLHHIFWQPVGLSAAVPASAVWWRLELALGVWDQHTSSSSTVGFTDITLDKTDDHFRCGVLDYLYPVGKDSSSHKQCTLLL